MNKLPSPKSDHRPFVLADLTADLLWPKLLRAAPLAMRPGRMAIAIIAVVLTGLIANIRLPVHNGRTIAALWQIAGNAEPTVPQLSGVVGGFLGLLSMLAEPALIAWKLALAYPWAALLAGVPIAIVLTLAACTIARMAAAETSTGVMMPMWQGARFAASQWRTLAAAFLVPAAVVGLIVLVQMLAGGVLLRWPVVNVLGALLFFVALIGSALAVLILACTLFGWPLIVPAVACEGGTSAGDGIDAVQRAFAYVLASPLRLAIYVAVLTFQLSLLLFLFTELAEAIVRLGVWSTSALLPDGPAALVQGANPPDDAPALSNLAAALLRYWKAVPMMVVHAFTLSFVASGGTMLYLLLRRLTDGQHENEIWEPDMIPGTISRTQPPSPAPTGDQDATGRTPQDQGDVR